MSVDQAAAEETSTPSPGAPAHHRPLLIAIAVATAVGAAALPVWRVGIGWPLCALAVAGAVLTARLVRDRSATDGGAERPATANPAWTADRAWRIAAGVAALVLSAVPAVRASGPLAVMCLGAAVLLGSYALTGGRHWLGILAGVLSFVPAAFESLGWSASNASQRVPRAGRVVLGIIAGAILLLVFGGLLRGADPVFDSLINSWLRGISTRDVFRFGFGAVLVGWAALAAAYQLRNRPRYAISDPGPGTRGRGLAATEWVIPLVLLDALFGLFVFVQLTTLFGGNEYVLGVGGPDYADYARGGFVQLTVVTMLTLGVVAVLAAWANRATAMDVGLIRVLGGVLCGLTLVIVASALKRLTLYADAYGFTWPRLLGFAIEAWLGLVFILVLAAGIRLRAPWFPRAAVATLVGVLIALAAVNPEALMARGVLARYGGPYPVDFDYVRGLSPDVVEELQKIPGRYCQANNFEDDLQGRDAWYEWNLGRERARAALRGKPIPHPYC
jgi:hypothetical protein